MYGRMLLEGRGVVCDLKAARTWFTRAADSGLSDAQVAFAEMMLNGRGGPSSAAGWSPFRHPAPSGRPCRLVSGRRQGSLLAGRRRRFELSCTCSPERRRSALGDIWVNAAE
jgi:TPR repeat protein